jgi:hypothetical protein
MLLRENKDGWGPLDEALQQGHIQRVPIRLRVSTLQKLLKGVESEGEESFVPEESRKWLREQIARRTLKECLQKETHPDI